MTRSYNPNDYTIYFAGHLIDRGIQSLNISPEVPQSSGLVSIDGDTTRVMSNNKNMTCEIVLVSTSPANDVLSELWNAARSGANGGGIGTFSIVNSIGTDEVTANKAWIDQGPDLNIGAEPADRTWLLYLEAPDVVYGSLPEV